jgi:hypothetical protein
MRQRDYEERGTVEPPNGEIATFTARDGSGNQPDQDSQNKQAHGRLLLSSVAPPCASCSIMLALLPNDWQISCKRPEKTYVPYRLKERFWPRSRGRSPFVGCIAG